MWDYRKDRTLGCGQNSLRHVFVLSIVWHTLSTDLPPEPSQDTLLFATVHFYQLDSADRHNSLTVEYG